MLGGVAVLGEIWSWQKQKGLLHALTSVISLARILVNDSG